MSAINRVLKEEMNGTYGSLHDMINEVVYDSLNAIDDDIIEIIDMCDGNHSMNEIKEALTGLRSKLR